MTKKKLAYGACAAALALGTVGFLGYARGETAGTTPVTRPVSRGDIVQSVTATGTLEAVNTVEVGSQVSGTVESLHADFNSLVRKGEIIARLDPSLFDTQVQQARANLVKSQADLQRMQVAAADAAQKLQRAGALSENLLISAADLEAANVAKQSADAQVQSAEAGVTQSTAALAQAEVTRDKTVIAAPIDGIVIARNVDVGQTVAASVEAPTLFVIAADLREMRLIATIDESDVGAIRAGQHVDFRVGAYPDEWFTGTVEQLRQSAVVVENVVTYAAVIAVPNSELKLKPGMTATLTIETDKRSNVTRVPNAALQYRPAGVARAKGPEVWIESSEGPTRVAPTTGMSDGTYTEVQSGNLAEGALVITGDRTAAAAAQLQTGAASGNPFAATQQRPAFPRN